MQGVFENVQPEVEAEPERVRGRASENWKLHLRHEIDDLSNGFFLLTSTLSPSLHSMGMYNLSNELTQLISFFRFPGLSSASKHRILTVTFLPRIESVRSLVVVVLPGHPRPMSTGESVCVKLLWVSLT
jgi:hypothetical protein